MDEKDLEIVNIRKKTINLYIYNIRLREKYKTSVESIKIDELSDEDLERLANYYISIFKNDKDFSTLKLQENDYSDFFSQIITILDKQILKFKQLKYEYEQRIRQIIKENVRNQQRPYGNVNSNNPGFFSSWRLRNASLTPSKQQLQLPSSETSEFHLGGKRRTRRKKCKKRKNFRKTR
jgi:hypothetical protein